jgi:hypothetical protein
MKSALLGVLISCLIFSPSYADGLHYQPPTAGNVRVVFMGDLNHEPVEFELAGKKTRTTVTTTTDEPYFPAQSDGIDLQTGKLPATLIIRFPRLKLMTSIALKTDRDRWVGVGIDKNRIVTQVLLGFYE